MGRTDGIVIEGLTGRTVPGMVGVVGVVGAIVVTGGFDVTRTDLDRVVTAAAAMLMSTATAKIAGPATASLLSRRRRRPLR